MILPLFQGLEVSLLPGCRCSRSTNGSTTPDQPCIGGGLGLWPTHGLISGEFGGISVRNFPRQFPPFPLGCLKTQKGHPSCVKVWREGCSVFYLELLICLPLWSQRRAIPSNNKNHATMARTTSHMKLDQTINFFNFFSNEHD